MPELPEVEALAAFLRANAVGLEVLGVDVVALSALKTFDPPVSSAVGAVIVDVGRHGKFLDVCLRTPAAGAGEGVSGPDLHLMVHLARAGWLRWREQAPSGAPKPGRGPLAVRVSLGPPDESAGRYAVDLTEAGTRKSLALHLVRNAADVAGVARLGPDALTAGLTADDWQELAHGARVQLKGWLTDQTVVAGVGNAYSDEILHLACLSPFRLAASLDASEVGQLSNAVRELLTDAVARSVGQGAARLKAEKRSGMRVHGRTGLPCPVCGDTVGEVAFADSSLQYCPTCQTGGRPLADRRLSRLVR